MLESQLTVVLPAGHVAFFGFIAELRDPKDYPKSLVLLQGTDTLLYLITAVVIYCYAGQGVTSPALGSAGDVVAKVAYGVALPTVCLPTSQDLVGWTLTYQPDHLWRRR